MHARTSVSGLCFPTLDLSETLEKLESLGAGHTTFPAAKLRGSGWDAGLDRLRASGLGIAALIERPFSLAEPATWAETRARITETIDVAASIGAPAIYLTTGAHISAEWGDCAAAFADAIAPAAEHAATAGVRLLIEPTSWLYADFSFVHSFADALQLTKLCDVGVCLDVFHVWTEAGLHEHLNESVERVGLVQISDYVLGDRSLPARAVPGDGGVPIGEIVSWLLAAGYDGMFDLELSGPRIDAEGHLDAARRAMSRLDDIVSAAGHRPSMEL